MVKKFFSNISIKTSYFRFLIILQFNLNKVYLIKVQNFLKNILIKIRLSFSAFLVTTLTICTNTDDQDLRYAMTGNGV